MPSPNDQAQKSIDQLIGNRVRAVREAAGLTQRVLAERLGVSHQKVHALESGQTRALVSDLAEIAIILKVSPWQFLAGVLKLPDLDSYQTARVGELAWKAPDSVNHMVAADMWIERYYRIKYRMDYRPIYYTQPYRRPLEFVEEWSQPVPASPRRLLYIAEEKEGLAGYFFPDEIVPAPTLEHYDTPVFTGVEKWKNNEELEAYLKTEGYCWQLYPVKMHHDRFCSPAHRAEIESQRREARVSLNP